MKIINLNRKEKTKSPCLWFWLLAILAPGTVFGQADYATPYTITTIAGATGASGSVDGVGTAAQFYFPDGMAVDSATNLYVADGNNCTIRKMTMLTAKSLG